jgi:GTPase SAR1 family protein
MINVDLDDDVYIPIKKQHCRYGHGYILICAINDRKSFEELESFVHLVYLEKDYIDDRLVPMILVVTKSDSHERQISNAELKEFVERHSLGGCVITSAKDGTNCQEAILQMLQVIKYRFMPREIIEKVGKGLSVTESQKKCNIC